MCFAMSLDGSKKGISESRDSQQAASGYKIGNTDLSGYVPSGGGSNCMAMSGMSWRSLGASRFKSVGSAMLGEVAGPLCHSQSARNQGKHGGHRGV